MTSHDRSKITRLESPGFVCGEWDGMDVGARGWWWVGGDVTGRDSCVCYDHCIDSLYNLTGRYMCTVCPICDGWYVNHAREGNSASEIVVASENECERRKSGDE